MVRRFLCGAVLLLGVLAAVWTAPAHAQTPTPNSNYQGCQAFISDLTVEPGQVVTISGSGANPGDTVTATMDPTVASGTADSNGNFAFSATIAATQSRGATTLVVTCGANGGSARIIVVVLTTQPTPTTVRPTPTTGPPTTTQRGPGGGTLPGGTLPGGTLPGGGRPGVGGGQGGAIQPTPGSGALPRTGTDSTIPLTRIGVALVAVGGLLLAVARRRRWAHQTSMSN